jgi:histidinol-phosphate aminotransferase
VCNPNNPTGTLTPTDAIRQALANKPDGSVLVVDEAYIDFADAPSVVSWVKDHDDLLVLRTFSKIYGMAGARLGLAIGHLALLERLAVFGGDNVPAGASLLGGLASLEDSTLLAQRKALNADCAMKPSPGSRPAVLPARRPQQLFHDRREATRRAGRRGPGAHGVKIGRVWTRWPQWVRVTGEQRGDGAFSAGICGAGGACVTRRNAAADTGTL